MEDIAFVTGAEGFIGSYLATTLARKGIKTVGTYHGRAKPKLDGSKEVEWKYCEVCDAASVDGLIQEVRPDFIFHLAAQSSPSILSANPAQTLETNVIGSLHVFEAARRLQTQPVIVVACSSAEYGFVDQKDVPVKETYPLQPIHPYGVSKAALDLLAYQYFVSYGMRIVRLRLFNTIGPGKINDAPSDFIRQLVKIKQKKQEAVVRVGNLETRRAFLDVEDAVRAFELAAYHGKSGEAYNVCASTAVSMRELLDTAIRAMDVCVEIRCVPELMRPAEEKIIFGDCEKFKKDTGWRAECSLKHTVRSMIDFWSLQPD